MPPPPTIVEVENRKLKLSNLDKVLYPAAGFTKGQVIDYYVRIAPALLPDHAGHQLTMKRYPEGVDHEYFFEKNAPNLCPGFVISGSHIWVVSACTVNYILANDLA